MTGIVSVKPEICARPAATQALHIKYLYLALTNDSSTGKYSLLPPINLAQKAFKHAPLQSSTLIHIPDHFLDPPHNILLVIQVHLLQFQLLEHFLDPSLLLRVLASVAFVQHVPLLRTRQLQRLVDEPRAFVVLDVGADFPNRLRGAVGVEVVVLDLEVFAEGDEDVFALLEVFRGGELEVVEGEGDGEVEGVVGCFVDDDEAVFFGGEVVEVDVVFGRREQVTELADLRLEGGGVEEVDDVGVVGVGAEVFLQEDVDGHFEHEGVVDGDHAHALLAVPARLAPARYGRVHDVVRDQEEGLEQLGEPAEGGGEEVFRLFEGPGEEEGGGVWDGEAAIAFSAQGVVIE